MRLLLVDDELTVRQYVKFIIKENRLPFEDISEAGNGREACEIAKTFKPDVVLMDIRMPDMDGLEASRHLRAHFPKLKIIVLSAYEDFSYAQEAIRFGATEYLLKPVEPDVLQDLFSSLLVSNERTRESTDESDQPRSTLCTYSREDVLKKAVEFIETHYTEALCLEDVAKAVYLSPYYFSRLFKEKTGLTFPEYINRLRISKAKILMLKQTLSIGQIAEQVGYSDQSYFAKVFKEFEGRLPREYRKTIF